MTEDASTLKNRLRRQCRAARAALSIEAREEYAKAFARHFLKNVDVEDKIIAGYSSFRDELDILPLLAMLARGNRICSLPVTSPPSKELIFRRWHEDTKMVEGAFGILNPGPESEVVTPDIIIVPLIGFDKEKHRIGYGEGYYDCTLERLNKKGYKPRTIGAAYSMQQLEKIPAEAHDQTLDLIITEKGVLGRDF